MFCFGIITPCVPFKPLILHIWKNPSILSFAPPIGWISPFWLTEPVTAIAWLIGIPDKLERIAYNSVEEALSPSTPLYNCSKHILAVSERGISCANVSPMYALNIRTPFEWVDPESSTSLSILITPLFPV